MRKIEKPYGIIYQGNCLDVLKTLPDESVNCCVTSPPYWGLRDYKVDGQLGLEPTPEEYVSSMVDVFCEVKRVLRKDGTCFLNIGDSYASQPSGNKNPSGFSQTRPSRKKHGVGMETVDLPKKHFNCKPKDLVGIPWAVAFALRQDGWYLRQDIIWHKPNPMPESVTDRCTKAHEYIFLLSKSARYYYDADAIKENSINTPEQQIAKRNKQPHKGQSDPGGMRETTGGFDNITKVYEARNKRSVWTVSTKPFSEAHFATFPPDLIEPCILAGCPADGIVLDPFFGAGTTGVVAYKHDRQFIGIELSEKYVDEIIIPRLEKVTRQMKLFAT